MGAAQIIVLMVAGQRLAELALARRHTRDLLAQGAHEVGAGHYPLLVGLHAAWLGALYTATPPETAVSWPLVGLFVLLQIGRAWVIATLGRFWTTRIIVLPDTALVRRGPYRYLRHPNYTIVAAEIAVLPLAFGQEAVAILFTAANLLLIRHRISIENEANAAR